MIEDALSAHIETKFFNRSSCSRYGSKSLNEFAKQFFNSQAFRDTPCGSAIYSDNVYAQVYHFLQTYLVGNVERIQPLFLLCG